MDMTFQWDSRLMSQATYGMAEEDAMDGNNLSKIEMVSILDPRGMLN